ncbi:hypothetical protein Q5752_003733 [Cryptotrichosporon argae]
MSRVPSAEAFALVRRLLTDRPRHFRELVADGVAATHADAGTSAGAGAGVGGLAAAAVKGKGKARAGRDEAGASSVPDGHPFVSGTFLKKRILPVLESQHLVVKRATLPFGAKSEREKKQFLFSLAPASDADAVAVAGQWDRVLSGAPLAVVGGDYLAALDSAPGAEETLSAKERERAERRKEVEVKLGRVHLNTRRARARGEKEERRMRKEQERARMWDEVKEEARREAGTSA